MHTIDLVANAYGVLALGLLAVTLILYPLIAVVAGAEWVIRRLWGLAASALAASRSLLLRRPRRERHT